MDIHLIEKNESLRLLIRKVEKEDWLVLFKAVKNSTFPSDLPLKEKIQTETDAQKWIEDGLRDWKESKKYTWSICVKENPTAVIGQISISKMLENHKWSMAFWISAEYQNLGYAKESVVTLMEILKDGDNNIGFWAGAATWNVASNKVLINSGFKLCGTQENGYVCNGKMNTIDVFEKN